MILDRRPSIRATLLFGFLIVSSWCSVRAQTPKSETSTRENPEPSRAPAPALDERGVLTLLSDEEAWKRLPPATAGSGQPLPNWARALAGTLPRTTAAMLNLDRLHRTKNPIGPALRGKMRWVAADANRCEYSRATAEADLRRAGIGDEAILALKGGPDRWDSGEKDALEFAKQMTRDASIITDTEVDRLRETYGEAKLVAMVQLLAAANFQDRLLLSLGTPLEANGPMAPPEITFAKEGPEPSTPARARPDESRGALVPTRVDDPEWTAQTFDALQKNLGSQRANPGRIRVPTHDEVMKVYPADYPKPKTPIRIQWSLVCFGYQPEFAAAWSRCMKAYDADAKLDEIFGESLFWVVTRTIQCFY